jgi:hypothetical protein
MFLCSKARSHSKEGRVEMAGRWELRATAGKAAQARETGNREDAVGTRETKEEADRAGETEAREVREGRWCCWHERN